MNADEVKHIQKQAVIDNLSNEVIVNKNFLHTNDRTSVMEKIEWVKTDISKKSPM